MWKQRFYNWLLPIKWPHYLVTWRGVDDQNGISVQTVAGWFDIPPEVISSNGFMLGHRRWPSMDDLMLRQMEYWADHFEAVARMELDKLKG